MRSIRSSSRARTTSQRGFALIAAITLAILYFALIELMLIDSSRELAQARRFRAKIVSATLAENGAELAAAAMLTRVSANVSATDFQGTISGTLRKPSDTTFEISGAGSTTGVVQTTSRVELRGTIEGARVKIEFAVHNP